MLVKMGEKLTVLAFSALLVAMFALAGCASSQSASNVSAASDTSASASSASASSTASDSSASASAAASSDLALGEKTATSENVTFTNDTGTTLVGLALKPAGTDAEPTTLVVAGEGWGAGQTADVSFEPQGSGRYDIVLDAGTATYTLHDFDADLIPAAQIRLSGEVAYVTYEQFGNEKSTLDAELALHEAQVAAEAEAAAAAEAEAAAEQTYSYDNAPTYNQQPAQSNDSCIDGGVVLR